MSMALPHLRIALHGERVLALAFPCILQSSF
jgi:hypothetical protein